MQVFLDDQEQSADTEAAPLAIAVGPGGVRLRVSLGDGEELDSAEVALQRDDGADPGFALPDITTDHPDGSLQDIAWITADWGEARTVRSVSLNLTVANDLPVRVRFQIGRGASGWYAPPGPHTFTVISAGTLLARFPDTVADRIMVDFTNGATGQPTTGQTATVTLGADPELSFGNHARDFHLRVVGHRDFFSHTGELGAEPVAVAEVIEHLRAAAGTALAGVDLEMELYAEVGGMVALSWSFARLLVVSDFAGSASLNMSLGWDEEVVTTLAELAGGADRRPESVELLMLARPVAETMVPGLATASERRSEALAALGRPLQENAQRFAVDMGTALAGVDLYTRALSRRVVVDVEVRADASGQPAATAIDGLTGTVELSGDGAPGWLAVALEEPVAVPGVFWVVVRVREGELLWYVAGDPPAAAEGLRYRHNGGAWLGPWPQRPELEESAQEEPEPEPGPKRGTWALTRLRARAAQQPAPPVATLLFVAEDGTSTEVAMTLEDNMLRWRAPEAEFEDEAGAEDEAEAGDETEATPVSRVDLRLRAAVAGEVTLSRLRLAYYP